MTEKNSIVIDEIVDPVEEMLKRTGCIALHYGLQDCMAEKQDWRKCQKEVQEFRQCMQVYQSKKEKEYS